MRQVDGLVSFGHRQHWPILNTLQQNIKTFPRCFHISHFLDLRLYPYDTTFSKNVGIFSYILTTLNAVDLFFLSSHKLIALFASFVAVDLFDLFIYSFFSFFFLAKEVEIISINILVSFFIFLTQRLWIHVCIKKTKKLNPSSIHA